MRKQLLGILVPLMAFVLIASAADVTGKGASTSAALQKLEVANSQDGLQVEFKATGNLAPKVTTLDSPSRIVVDFPNTVMATGQSRISVGRDGVKDIRVGMDGQNPPTTRVVVDLTDSRQHELMAGREGVGFVLQIHPEATKDAVVVRRQPATAAKSAAVSAAPKLTLASATTTSVSPASTTSISTISAATISAPATPAPVASTTTTPATVAS